MSVPRIELVHTVLVKSAKKFCDAKLSNFVGAGLKSFAVLLLYNFLDDVMAVLMILVLIVVLVALVSTNGNDI